MAPVAQQRRAQRLDGHSDAAEGEGVKSLNKKSWWLVGLLLSAALGCGGSSKPAAPKPVAPVAAEKPSEPTPEEVAAAEQEKAEAEAAAAAAADPDGENNPRVKAAIAVLEGESLGGVKPGMEAKEVEKLVGKASKKGKAVAEEATGETVATWEWKKAGLRVTFSDAKKKPVARMISLGAGAKLKTQKGVGIGSTLEELDAAYSEVRRPPDGEDQTQFIVGTMYLGMSFELKDGKVVAVYWGALAE